ncbi:uncharacterized protein LOC124168175 [Ischnura elegans]|uniref:uncharacterized protein LOC124168175 n=1 Tax=Ischnura elegans TaxID=197161 RepID=UPI001ED8802E|nr:uncharacterized protein LOC124168175 [Ischnura elegans]
MCPGTQQQQHGAESPAQTEPQQAEQESMTPVPPVTPAPASIAMPSPGPSRKGPKGGHGANGKGEEGSCGGPKRRAAIICLSVLLVLCFAGCLLLIFLPCLPPYVSFPEYNATLPRPLIGRQLPKDWLSGAKPVETEVAEGLESDALTLLGPESLARRGGDLFTGILGGELLRLTPHNGGFQLANVTKFGEQCDDISEGLKCGRPMGMRFHTDGLLYVTDAYLGLYSVNVETGEKKRLAKAHDYISGHRTKLANDLDIAKDGTVYWSDASTNVRVEDVMLEFMSEPSGRLIRYDPVKKKSEALIRRVQCANGVQLSPDEDFVLVAEGGKDRILRYYLKGPKTGSSDIFIDGLPGVPDKIRKSGRPEGGYFVWCIISHGSAIKGSSGGILPWLRKHRIIRTMLMRGLYILESMFQNAHERFGDTFSRKAIYSIGNLASMAPFLLSEGLVVELDAHGNITGSFYSADRSVHMASEMHVLPGGHGGIKGLGSIYVASPINPHLLEVPIREGPMLEMAMAYSKANTAPEPKGEGTSRVGLISTKPEGDRERTKSNAVVTRPPAEMEWSQGEDDTREGEFSGSTDPLTDNTVTDSSAPVIEERTDEEEPVMSTMRTLPSLADMVASWMTNLGQTLRTTTEPSQLESFFATADSGDVADSTTLMPQRDASADSDEVISRVPEERKTIKGSGEDDDDDKGNLVQVDPVLQLILSERKKAADIVNLGQNDTTTEEDDEGGEGERNFIALDSIIDLTTVTTPPPTTEKEGETS